MNIENIEVWASLVNSTVAIVSKYKWKLAKQRDLHPDQEFIVPAWRFLTLSFSWFSLVLVYELIIQPYGSMMSMSENREFTGILLLVPALLISFFAVKSALPTTGDHN